MTCLNASTTVDPAQGDLAGEISNLSAACRLWERAADCISRLCPTTTSGPAQVKLPKPDDPFTVSEKGRKTSNAESIPTRSPIPFAGKHLSGLQWQVAEVSLCPDLRSISRSQFSPGPIRLHFRSSGSSRSAWLCQGIRILSQTGWRVSESCQVFNYPRSRLHSYSRNPFPLTPLRVEHGKNG